MNKAANQPPGFFNNQEVICYLGARLWLRGHYGALFDEIFKFGFDAHQEALRLLQEHLDQLKAQAGDNPVDRRYNREEIDKLIETYEAHLAARNQPPPAHYTAS